MLRAVSDDFVVAALAITSPDARLEGGRVQGLVTDHMDAADALAAVARATGGACVLRFGALLAAPGAEDPLRLWVQRELADARAFDDRAFRSAAMAVRIAESPPEGPASTGSFRLLKSADGISGVDVHVAHPEPRTVRVRWRSPEQDGDFKPPAATGRLALAVAFEATRTLVETSDEQRALQMTSTPDAARGVARLIAAVRRLSVMDAARGTLRADYEAAVPPIIRQLWPLEVPAKRMRMQPPCRFFEHASLIRAALCFDEAMEATPTDDQEWLLLCFPGGDSFGIGRAHGRARMDRRARATCRLEARTAAPPSELRGAFFWRKSGITVKDVNVFPRSTDSAEDDARLARAAVDSVGFNRATAAVWINADEARQELEDMASS